MKWYHEVDREWLAARKNYVTASDIRKLLPVTAGGRARTAAVVDEAYMKVWAEKQCAITDEDVCSTGAAARGHLLERFAIIEFNKLGLASPIFHWDDTLVYSTDGVSCSPDGLNIIQPEGCPKVLKTVFGATEMVEVKSYGSTAHYICGAFTSKEKLEERWQVATAFYTMPSLVYGWILFYNPSAANPLFHVGYSRKELAEEMEMIAKINIEYGTRAATFETVTDLACPQAFRLSCATEDAIIAQLTAEAEAAGGLNPGT